MASIDERVVEMQFRRDDFLKGTEETLSALQNLEGSLSGAGGISAGVDQISRGIGGMGVIAFTALNKIVGAAMNAGAALVKNVIDPIFTGGKKRALNLEQANFQLMGILGNAEEVDKIMENVSYGVNDTAYGLDAAAVAAAQFAATGMRAGTDMENALRGISGVAAMAGSSYEDIASIFTKVAGQGRLMGDDLNRLASRGINAAATLAEAMGKTEAEVRKMVSRGEIDFETFAAAMNGAFGEHATAANETYTGSLANLRAALARVGAAYFTIEHEKMRRVFNALRPIVNNFLTALEPVFDIYERMYAIPMAEKFERFAAAVAKVDLNPIGTIMSQLMVIFKTFGAVAGSWLKPIGDAFKSVFSAAPTGSWMATVIDFLDSFNRGIWTLEATEGQALAVKNAFTGIFTALDTILSGLGSFFSFISGGFAALGPVVKYVWDLFKTGIDYVIQGLQWLTPYIVDAFDALFGQESRLGQFWDEFQGHVEETGSVMETLGHYFRNFYDKYLDPVVQSFKNFGDVLRGLKDDGLSGLGARLEAAFAPLEPAWEWLKEVWNTSKEFLTGLKNPFSWLTDQLPGLGTWILDIFSSMGDGLKTIFDNIGGVFGVIGDLLSSLRDALSGLFEGVTTEDLEKLGEVIGKLILLVSAFQALNAIKDVGTGLTGMFNDIGESFKGFSDAAKMMAAESKGDLFLKIAIGLGLLAVSLWLLSKIEGEKLLQGASALIVLAAALVGFMWVLSKIDGEKLKATAGGMALLAFALFGLTVVLVILALIPFPALIQGMGALFALLMMVTVVAAVLGVANEHVLKAGGSLVLLAFALNLLVVPLVILGMLPYEVLKQGLIGVGLALLGLMVAVLLLGTMKQNITVNAVAILILAAALTALIVPITTLGEMSWDTMVQGLVGLSWGMGLLLVAALAMQFLTAGAIGLLAISIALIALAHGISILAAVPFDAGSRGIELLAMALGVLILASAGALVVLPGVLALAGLMLAFAIAAIAIGAGALMMAQGAMVLAAALPGLSIGLMMFAQATEQMMPYIDSMILIGAALAIFSAGAIPAALAATGLGIGLVLLGAGLLLLQASGTAGTEALEAFVKSLRPLLRYVPDMLVMTGTFAALGAALIVLGAGLLLAGAGGIVFGAGMLVAGIGVAAFIALAALVSPLADRVVTSFQALGQVAGPVLLFAISANAAAEAMLYFYAAAIQLRDSLQDLNTVLMMLGISFVMASTNASLAASAITLALLVIASSVQAAGDMVGRGVEPIIKAFEKLALGVMATAPITAAAVMMVVTLIVASLNAGQSSIAAAIALITLAFTMMAIAITLAGTLSVVSVKDLMNQLTRILSGSVSGINTAIRLIVTAFNRLPTGISQNRSTAVSAVGILMLGVVNGLTSARGSASSAAYSVGTAIGTGMVNGITAQRARVVGAARTMATAAAAGARAALQIRSPSRIFIGISNAVVDGFLLPIESRASEVEDATGAMGDSAASAVRAMIESLNDDMDEIDDWDFTPTITPVLDLDSARNQARGFGGFGATISDYGAAQASSLARLEEVLLNVADDRRDERRSEVTFIQNNESPKALSNSEIYRNTKNLISQVERKGL